MKDRQGELKKFKKICGACVSIFKTDAYILLALVVFLVMANCKGTL
jgi:hypothetical protein